METKNADPQILKDMREWLSDSKRWCKGSLFRSTRGLRLMAISAEKDPKQIGACCLVGSYIKVTGEYNLSSVMYGEIPIIPPELKLVADCAGDKAPQGYIPTFNDSSLTTHEDVLKVLDCAISKAEDAVSSGT